MFFLFLLFLTASAQAQTVRGTVTDAATGEPLFGATVQVEGTARGAASRMDGTYALSGLPAGAVVLVARSIGYEPQRLEITLQVGAVTVANFALEPLPFHSEEVIVTAARREQAAANVPVSVSVMTPAEIARRNPVTLDEALRYVPGVQLTENQVNVRGSSGFAYGVGSRVMFLLDGQPMLGPEQGNIKFDTFPLSQIAQIEVVKGPGSALYGGGALGGVVNLITKEFPEQPELEATSFAGVYGPVGYEVWRESWEYGNEARPFGGAQVFAAAPLGATAGAWANLAWRFDDGYVENIGQRQLQGYGKIGWQFQPGLRFDLFGGHSFSRSDVFLFWDSARRPLRVADSDFVDGSDQLTVYHTTLLPSFTHAPSSTFTYSVRGRYFRGHVVPLDGLGRTRPEYAQTLGVRYGAELQTTWQPNAALLVTSGLSGDLLAGRSKFFGGEESTGENVAFRRGQPEAAAYVQVEKLAGPASPLEALHLVGGLRFDYYRIDEVETATQLSPKLNVAFSPSDRIAYRASVGLGFRVPSIAERFVKNSEHLPLEPNPFLNPEKSTGYEVGVRGWLVRHPRGIVRYDVAGFWTEYRQLVEPRFVEALNAFRFENLTRARIRGLEAMVEASDSRERHRLRLSYTFLDPDDLTTSEALVFRSRHLLHAALAFRPLAHLELGTDFRYASRPERITTEFSRFVTDADLFTDQRILDLRLATEFAWAGAAVETALLIKNALQHYYVERPAILAPTRRVMLQLQIRL